MKILLVSANRERSPYPVFPIGLAYLAPPLAAAGHELRAIDLCFAAEPEAAMTDALADFVPDAVVISVRNIDNVTWPGSRSYLAGVRAIVARCRGKAPTIIGGSGFSLMPAELLEHFDGDFGLVGEGEEILPELIRRLEQGEETAGLPGVVVRGEVRFAPPLPVGRIGTPDRSLFALERYRREGGMANLQTKRGCPFACVYCTYPLLEGRRMRLRPAGEIVAELKELEERRGIDYVYFVDDIFNYPPDFAGELCAAMAAAGVKLNWSAFVNPGFVTTRLVEQMVAAGCDAVEYGTDSGSPAMLASLGKSFTVADVRDASRICREVGVDFAHYILFGGPGENRETVRESFALMDEVEPTAVIAMTGIRIFPGTQLYDRAVAEGMVAGDAALLEPVFYLSPEVRDELRDLVTAEAMQRRNWVAPGLEINMSDAMLEAMRQFPVRGPLWKLMKRLGRSRVNPFCQK
ncbi:lipid biosynthesis B12-binding/radical SAM protein [Geobacter sp.]|uniref:lipid biosynthesis B12-binding/radical SAM protein n=1 Tax=Geobacter sp. TaxID=46610 RepID=UPI002613852A|nr:lipid biosynthesis B12-binding/radical SAM protein [Geobacter sp.]